MTNIESQIEGVEKFIERLNEKQSFSSGLYWALMRNAAYNKNRTPKDTLATNKDTPELEESLSMLADEVRLAHSSGENVMHVRLYSDDKLTNLVGNRKYRIKEVKSENGIFGIGGGTNNIAGFLINSHQQALGQIYEAKTDLLQTKMQRQIKDLQDELEFERNNKETTLEKLGNSLAGFVESPEGIGKILETVNNVTGLIQMWRGSKALGNIPTAQPSNVPAFTEDQKRWLQAAEKLEEVYDKDIFQLISIIIFHKTHFPSKFDKILMQMAKDCEKKRIELENQN